MTPQQARALALGCKLAELIELRDRRPSVDPTTIFGSRYLLTTARIDHARRGLRHQLFDALLECPGTPAESAGGGHESGSAWRPGWVYLRDYGGRHAAS